MATATEIITQHFEVGTHPAIRLRNMAGNVQIVTGSDGNINIVATKKVSANLENLAQNELSQLTVELRQDGDTIHAEGKITQEQHLIGGLNRSIDFVITVPALVAQDLSLNAGELTITGTRGQLALDHNAGDVYLAHMILTTGSTVKLNAGNATWTGCTIAADVEIKHNAGNVTGEVALNDGVRLTVELNAGSLRLALPEATSARLNAHVSVGDITISGFPITPRRKLVQVTAEGDLNPQPRSKIDIKVSAGNVHISAR